MVPYHPTPFEVATGWVHGLGPPAPHVADDVSPREALARSILPALASPPCFVAFSGGRDSSAVLATATFLARQHGLAEPVPVTEVYPGLQEADESEWQEMVVRHLGLAEWVRLEWPGDNDILCPAAKRSLKSHGLLWPPMVHNKVDLLAALSPGALLTGEGGDEVLGPRRATAWHGLARGSPIQRARGARGIAAALLPRPLRERRGISKWRRRGLQPWLKPSLAEEHFRLLARDEADEPLAWGRALMWLSRRRSALVTAQNYAVIAADHGLAVMHPLLDRPFLAALGSAAGSWGFPDRTAAMAALFGDLLPRPVVERKTKALFNRAFLGTATRDFAASWDGSGVDPELIDHDRLREEWLSECPSALSSTLLHSAWLHSAGERGVPADLA